MNNPLSALFLSSMLFFQGGWLFSSEAKVSVSSPTVHPRKARERAQGLADKYYREGVVAYIKGDNAKALENFNAALKYQPDHSGAKAQIDKLNEETDEKKLKVAKEKYNLGLTVYMNGDIEKAISLWGEALRLDPYNPSIQKALDRARTELREKEQP